MLDFQDAVYGPRTYDLVSLFKDAYIHWEEARTLGRLAMILEIDLNVAVRNKIAMNAVKYPPLSKD